MNKDHLRAQLARQEGRKTRPYKDTKGKITWGVGRNTDDRDWSPDELVLVNQLIDLCLDNDIAIAEKEARKYDWFTWLSPMRQNVICNLIFNMGGSKFYGFKKFHSAMADGRWADAAHELDDSKWQDDVDPILGDGKGRADELIAQIMAG